MGKRLNKKIIISIIGLVGVLLAIGGVFCPWISVKNGLEAGGIISRDISGWEMTSAEVGANQVWGDFWPNQVNEFLVFTTKQSANFTPYVELFGCIFMLVFGIPIALAGRPKVAGILLMIGTFFALVGALAALGDYGTGWTPLEPSISGVIAIEQSIGYGIYMCLIGSVLGLVCAVGELVIWAKKRGIGET